MSLRRCKCGAQGRSQLSLSTSASSDAVAIMRERASAAPEPCLKGHETLQQASHSSFLPVVPVLLPETSPSAPWCWIVSRCRKPLPFSQLRGTFSKPMEVSNLLICHCSTVVVPTHVGGHDDRRSLPASFNYLRLLRQAPRRDPGDAGWRSWRSQRERLPSPALGSSPTGLCRSPGWSLWCSP
jgi:hypothetical protein